MLQYVAAKSEPQVGYSQLRLNILRHLSHLPFSLGLAHMLYDLEIMILLGWFLQIYLVIILL